MVCTLIHLSQTLKEKNTWNEHFTTYIRDLDKKKPVIWMGDLNVAPTAIGARFTSAVLVQCILHFYIQTWQMQSQIGIRHLDTQKMKRKRFKIFSILLNLLLELANLLMSGGRIIQKTNTTHISRTVLIVGLKALVGDWICVSC